MQKNTTNPTQRKRSTKTAPAATTNLNGRKLSAKKTEATIPAVREQALHCAPAKTAAASGDGSTAFSPAERREMIAIAAYRRAEQRGFPEGAADQDWLEAEAEIDRELGGQRS